MAGDWEPLLFRVKRDGGSGYTPTPEQAAAYQREHSPEMIARLKALGVNFVMIHCYKGAGLEAERQSMADAAQFAALCHEAGLRVGVYVTSGTLLWELFFKEKPEAKDWLVLDAQGKPITYRWAPAASATFGTATIRTPRPTTRRSSATPSKRFMRTCCTSTTMKLAPAGTPARWIGSAATSAARSHPSSVRAWGRPPWTGSCRRRRHGRDAAMCLAQLSAAQSLAESYYRMTRYARSLRPDILMECNPGGISPRIDPPIDHGRLIGGGEAFWDEDLRPGYHNKTLQTRIRTYKIARRMQNSAFTYVTTPLELAESMTFNLDCLGAVCWFEYGRITNFPGNKDPTDPAIQSFVQFFHQRRELLRDATVVADVAVLRSFASLAFCYGNKVPITWQVEQSLIENRIPFQIIYDQQLDDLHRYRAVVLAGCTAMSDPQAEQLRRYVHSGGRLCLIGPVATHNQWKIRRARPALDDLPDTALTRTGIQGDFPAAVRRACGDHLSCSVRGPHGLCEN